MQQSTHMHCKSSPVSGKPAGIPRRRLIAGIIAWLALIAGSLSPHEGLMALFDDRLAFAENIDPAGDGSKYAWGENIGWLNAKPSGSGGPGVTVEASRLTGYIWAENIGWVSLCCANTESCGAVDYCVVNNGSGRLSGYAWAENAGWISFSCENTGSCDTVSYGVAISRVNGSFSGYAWGENIGWVNFKPSPFHPGVRTSWRLDLTPIHFLLLGQ